VTNAQIPALASASLSFLEIIDVPPPLGRNAFGLPARRPFSRDVGAPAPRRSPNL